MFMFDRFKWYRTFVDSVNPVTMILVATLMFPLVVFIHNPNIMFYLAVLMTVILFIFSGIKYHYLLGMIIILLLLSTISVMYMVFYGEGETTLFQWGLIHITEESLMRGGHIFMRGFVMSSFGSLIIFTTKITDVFYSLMQQVKLPPKFAYAFMAGIRMVPIIFDEYLTLRRTRLVRGALVPRKYTRGLTGFITLIVTLLSQSIRRAFRLGIAMESKGFTNGPRTYYYKTSLSIYDMLFVVLIAIVVYLGFVLGGALPIFEIDNVIA
ncbi:energy-coupling factor transport system permease protein [Aliicoccus persicus]|uniref:Energy-coupling factor transport system permease protein n=2 Tax=Aliicoccus persicus TaxID=930138 RepID=A0A662Z2E3_9STAP|nr:energy-coupling factor transport system permease protein [Aliicoccus persicus]